MKLAKGDKVKMRAGRERGQTGTVVRVIAATDQVLVEGLGMVKRHTKPGGKHPRGGILDVARPIPAAKVGLVCPNCGQLTRIGYQIKGNAKDRICRKCHQIVGKK